MAGKKRRNLVRWVKRILMVVFLLAVASMVVLAYMPKPLPVETAEVQQGELVVTINEDGRTRVKDRYVVSAPLSGNLARIELHPGDDVEQGKVLARIAPMTSPLLDSRGRDQAKAQVAAAAAGVQQVKAQIERAKVALEFAEQEIQRIEPLVQQGVMSSAARARAHSDLRARSAELTSAKFAARVSAHQLELARSALRRFDHQGTDKHPKKGTTKRPASNTTDSASEQLVVSSPIQGRILKVIQASEGVIQAGSPLLEIGDPSALEIVVDVLTRDAVQIQTGAEVWIEGWGGKPLQANVRLVEPSAFTRLSALGVEEQRVNVIIDIDQPYQEWSQLGDGYRVDTKITVWKTNKGIKVPASALFRHENGWAVFAVQGKLAALVPVEIGRRNDLEAQIIKGLKAGDRVIIHPSDRVQDGIEVSWR